MANGTIGRLADLTAYRRAAAQPTINPLDALIQGFSQGQALQQLPEVRVQEALARQLNMELQRQKLRDLQNPQEAILREVQKALALKTPDITSGVISSPLGLEADVIAQPGALTPEQQILLQESQLVSDLTGSPVQRPVVAAVAEPITPITLAGTPTGFSQDLSSAIAGTEALSRAKGTTSLERQLLANAQAEANRISRERIAAEGNVSREGIAKTRSTGRGGRSILATNEQTGRVTNVFLNPGEELPEGFKQATKPVSDFKNVQALRKEVTANPVIKQFTEINKSKQRIDDALEESRTTNNFVGVDQALISSFNRMLEPDSVTMVSEYARTSADAPLLNRLRANIERVTQGGRLTQEERDALSRLSNRIYQTSLGNYSSTVDWYSDIAEKSGFDSSDIIQPLTERSAPVVSPVGTVGINPNAANPVQPTGLPRIISITPRKK